MITIKSGNATIYNVVRCWYSLALNEIRSFTIVTDGVDSTIRAELAIGNTVQIYRDGTLEFEGTIEEKEAYQGGGIIVRGLGQEVDFAEQKCPIDAGTHKKVYTSSNANTIFADIVGNVAGWSSDVVNSTATAIASFRTSDSQSAWNGIKDLLKRTKKDVLVNDSTQTLFLYDELTNSSVHVFNEGVNCGNVTHTTRKVKASKVVVYGKSDGENQIVGSAGSGTPVFEIVDRNIIETSEANARATTELARIVAAVNVYAFNVYNYSLTFRVGDEVTINADSLGLDSVTVDIVRIKRGLNQGGGEFLDLEVTNPAYRIASKNNAWAIAQLDGKSITANSSMQGSGNLSQWGNMGNANNSVPLKINFNVGAQFQDEAGNLQIRSMTLDYDVDKYKQSTGGASFDGTDPQVQNDSENNDGLSVVAENDYFLANDIISGTWTTMTTFVNIGSHGERITFMGNIAITGGDDTANNREYFVRIYNSDTGIYYPNTTGVRMLNAPVERTISTANTDSDSHIHGTGNGTYDYFRLADTPTGPYAVKTDTGIDAHAHDVNNFAITMLPNGNFTLSCPVDPFGDDFVVQMIHDGGAGDDQDVNIYVTHQVESRHKHNNGDYDVNAADIDNISIGDNIGEAGSTNATEVDIYLDFWNGSSWVQKHSIIGTGATLETSVDITNSGTYPDATGLWRVRIYTDNGSADFLQGIVDVKHGMDN